MTAELRTVEILAYRTPEGLPTCASNFPSRSMCEFLQTRRFGTVEVCGAHNVELERYPEPETYLKPHGLCPVWRKHP